MDSLDARRDPFIIRSIDNTALAAWMRCPREFLYGMLLHRRKQGAPRPPLAYGTTWHKILETHYKTGGNKTQVVAEAIRSWQNHDSPDDHRTLDRALLCYEQYLKVYGDHDKEATIWGKTVGYPASPVVECPTELWWQGALHPYTGKIDRIVDVQGMYIVEDHKSSSALGKTYFRQFDPSNQMMGYVVLAQKLTGLPIAGVRINAHAVLKTESKFERQTILFAQERLDEWASNYNVWIQQISRAIQIALGLEGRGSGADFIDLEKAPKTVEELCQRLAAAPQELLDKAFPYNFNACAGKYGPCSYVEVDTMPVRIRRRVLDMDFAYEPWNPLAEEEDAA